MMGLLDEELHCAASRTLPSLPMDQVLAGIRADREFVERLIGAGGMLIYGLNTLPGHRDDRAVDKNALLALQKQIIHSHLVPGDGRAYPPFATRCITLAKLIGIARGSTGLGEASFNWLLRAAQAEDFSPAIYQNQSYSSGDVIPAAYWAAGLLQWITARDPAFNLAPGEAMALINGNFIHAGLSLAQVPDLRHCQNGAAMFCALLRGITNEKLTPYQIDSAAPPAAREILHFVENFAASPAALQSISPQRPVSVRAIPQLVETLCAAIADHERELAALLARKSGNPLYFHATAEVYSQASFLAPGLTIAQSALIEALMFAALTIINQLNHVFSGEIAGLPSDGARPHDPLGSIQIIKELYGELEYFRTIGGRRAFAASVSTSRGIEDLCSFGAITCGILEELTRFFLSLTRRAIILLEIARQIFLNQPFAFVKLECQPADFLVDILKANAGSVAFTATRPPAP